MDDRTPTDPQSERPENLPEEYQEVPTPDPHRGEPTPPPQEGLAPEADPAVVRPEQQEENGPLPGLVAAAAAEATEEATPGGDPEAEALLAQMGVEEEGIEAGQILGLVAATVVAILALVVVLVLLFYLPFRAEVGETAEASARTTDLEIVRAEGLAKITDYGRIDSVYNVPIDRAMALVAAEYASVGAYDPASVAQQPTDAAGWNTLMVMRGPGRAVAAPDPRVPLTPAVPATGEEVGVDEPFETTPADEEPEETDPDDL